MGYDEQLGERVREILSGRPDVVEKKMIGGLSFMVGGKMGCGLTGSGLMVRVGAATLEWALAQPNVRPMEFAGRPLAGFVCVEPAGYRTAKALTTWVQRGIDFAATLPPTKPAAKRPRTKAPPRKTPPRGLTPRR